MTNSTEAAFEGPIEEKLTKRPNPPPQHSLFISKTQLNFPTWPLSQGKRAPGEDLRDRLENRLGPCVARNRKAPASRKLGRCGGQTSLLSLGSQGAKMQVKVAAVSQKHPKFKQW